jgi:ABC-2 type transport system ATP-binding protein
VTRVGGVTARTARTASPLTIQDGRLVGDRQEILAEAAGIAPSRRDELLERVDVTPAADRHLGGSSVGMRQRLVHAGAPWSGTHKY